MPILFIEGLPGSGKTTFAGIINDYLVKQGQQTVMYQEGELHPIDLAWCSYMEEEEFNRLLKKYSHLKADILRHTKYRGHKVITAYTKVRVDKQDVSLYEDFEEYEIYKGYDLNTFLEIHRSLYQSFRENIDDSIFYIFECVLLQNHINELILKFNIPMEDKKHYFNQLTESLQDKDVTVFYIKQTDIDTTLSQIIEERRSPDKEIYKDWIDLVIEYLGTQPYAKKLGYQGVEGVYQYFKDRQQIELDILQDFPLEHTVFELDQEYEVVKHLFIKYIETKWLSK